MSTISFNKAAAASASAKAPGVPFGLVLAVTLAALVMAPQAWSVWTRGTFLDPDDALQTVEIRDFLAGQPWFDLVPHRLAPSHPFSMHWSRLADAPLAVLQQLFGLMLPTPVAERAMRVTAPVLFFAAALWALLRIARQTVGPRGLVPVALLFATAAEPMTNFLPGHIHHHGMQAALLLLATAALVEAVGEGGRAWCATVAAALAVLSLGIGLQNLPFVAGLAAAAVLNWVVMGEPGRRPLASFGLGLLAAVPVFALDVPPSRYFEGACDAFSAAHLVLAASGAATCLVLTGLTRRLPTVPRRFAAGAAGAGVVLGLLAASYPQCLRDPMAGVDPVLKTMWLSGVGEALPLWRLIALSWTHGLALLLTLLTGLAATIAALLAAPPRTRAGWAVLLGLAAIGVAGTLWQVRVAASTSALMLPGLAWLVLQVFERASRHPGAPALFIAILAGAFGNGAGWNALALPLSRLGHDTAIPAADPAACFDPDAIAPLAALPPGLVLSTIDPGSAILADTAHSVLAAPYHRNGYGNRVSLLALAAPPEQARSMIESAGVRYLALCRTSNETAETVALHSGSLSAALIEGWVPDWLAPLGPRDATYLLYRVGSVASPPASSGTASR